MENTNYPQNWSEIKGSIISQWNLVSDEDLEGTMGDFDAIVGVLQDKYGESKDELALTLRQLVSPYGMQDLSVDSSKVDESVTSEGAVDSEEPVESDQRKAS